MKYYLNGILIHSQPIFEVQLQDKGVYFLTDVLHMHSTITISIFEMSFSVTLKTNDSVSFKFTAVV